MAIIKIPASTMSITEKIQFARLVVTDMTANANFTTPVPALTALGTAATALETAYNDAQAARLASKQKTTVQNVKDKALMALLSQEANYVQNVSAGDAVKIESSGFSVRTTPTPATLLPAPENLILAPSQSSGTVDVKWNKVKGAVSYVVQEAPDAAELVWANVDLPTKSKTTLNTMTSGDKYWFRVAAVNAAGQGAWSANNSIYAP